MKSVYMFRDPRNMQIRYVGITKNLRRRFNDHLSGRSESNEAKAEWIQELNSLGFKPIMELIEEVQDEFAEGSEQFWIAQYKTQGCQLFNLTAGGFCSAECSEETRVKLRKANLGRKHSPETLAKMSASHKNRKFSEDTIEKMRIAQSTPERVAIKRATNKRRGQRPKVVFSEAARANLKVIANRPDMKEKFIQRITGNKFNQGRVWTSEQKAHQSEAQKRRFAKAKGISTDQMGPMF